MYSTKLDNFKKTLDVLDEAYDWQAQVAWRENEVTQDARDCVADIRARLVSQFIAAQQPDAATCEDLTDTFNKTLGDYVETTGWLEMVCGEDDAATDKAHKHLQQLTSDLSGQFAQALRCHAPVKQSGDTLADFVGMLQRSREYRTNVDTVQLLLALQRYCTDELARCVKDWGLDVQD